MRSNSCEMNAGPAKAAEQRKRILMWSLHKAGFLKNKAQR